MLARLSFVAAVLVALLTMAQMPLAGFPPGAFSNKAALDPQPSGTYLGPGDLGISSATLQSFWSCGRTATAAYAASLGNMCIIADAATGLVTCTLVAKATGFVNLTDAYCSDSGLKTPAAFCTFVTSCVVSQMYDQVGTVEMTAGGTLNRMPVFTFSALNSLPCPSNTAGVATVGLSSSKTITSPIPFAFTALTDRTTFNSLSNHIWGNLSAVYMSYTSAANTLAMAAPTTISNTNGYDGAFHAIIADFDLNANADSVLVVDGTAAVSGATGSTALAGNNVQFFGNASNTPVVGYACEGSLWGGGFMSSTDYGTLNTNMHSAAYGWNF